MPARIQLQNGDSSHSRWITPGEAKRLEASGEIFRVMPRKSPVTRYRMKQMPEPSDSRNSPACVTQSDLRVLVGLQKANEKRVERLIGFGLLPETAFVTRTDYIRA
jgi:hypothetical protein